jgi:hypothetical protein
MPIALIILKDEDYDSGKGKARSGRRSRSPRPKSVLESNQLKDTAELRKRTADVIKGSEEVCAYLWDNYLEYVLSLEKMIKNLTVLIG